MRFRLVLVFLAFAFLAGSVASGIEQVPAYGGQADDLLKEQVQELRRQQGIMGANVDHLAVRISGLETLALERRLTRLETLGESNRTILLGLAGAMALQLLETLFRILAGGKRPREATQ